MGRKWGIEKGGEDRERGGEGLWIWRKVTVLLLIDMCRSEHLRFCLYFDIIFQGFCISNI